MSDENKYGPWQYVDDGVMQAATIRISDNLNREILGNGKLEMGTTKNKTMSNKMILLTKTDGKKVLERCDNIFRATEVQDYVFVQLVEGDYYRVIDDIETIESILDES